MARFFNPMIPKCANCQYSIINQDEDKESTSRRTNKLFCRNCDNVYCSPRCKIAHFTEGNHKFACGAEFFERYEGCGLCQRNGEMGPLCKMCDMLTESYKIGGGIHCQRKGEKWSATVDWGAIYTGMMNGEHGVVGGTEGQLPELIKRFGGCTCRGNYSCISPAQNLRFSWRRVGATNISFDGCCPLTVMEVFSTIGDLHMKMQATPGIGITNDQKEVAYKHVECYWQHKTKILFLLQRNESMGIWMAKCADLAYVNHDWHSATSKFKEVGRLGERIGFQVLDLLSTRGLGRIAMKKGNNQEALHLLTSSYFMVPFTHSTLAGSKHYKVSAQQYLLEAMMRCMWDNTNELSQWEEILEMKNLYEQFHSELCFQIANGPIRGRWEIRMLFSMNVKAALAEHLESNTSAVSAYLYVVSTCKESLMNIENRYFTTDVKQQMQDALERVQSITTVERFQQITETLLQAA